MLGLLRHVLVQHGHDDLVEDVCREHRDADVDQGPNDPLASPGVQQVGAAEVPRHRQRGEGHDPQDDPRAGLHDGHEPLAARREARVPQKLERRHLFQQRVNEPIPHRKQQGDPPAEFRRLPAHDIVGENRVSPADPERHQPGGDHENPDLGEHLAETRRGSFRWA